MKIKREISAKPSPKFYHTQLKSTDCYKAKEWLNDNYTRKILIYLGDVGSISVLSKRGKEIRSIKLEDIATVAVTINVSDVSHSYAVLMHLPNDYDLVLLFTQKDKRLAFLGALSLFLQMQGKVLDIAQSSTHELYQRAETKQRRQKKLEYFFKHAYAEAFQIPLPEVARTKLTSLKQEDIMKTEVTKAEFADALGMKANDFFVERIFAVADVDKNGRISYQEFLDIVILFTKGTLLEKIRILFRMFDVSGCGLLGKEKLAKIILSLVHSTGSQFEAIHVQNLVDAMLSSAGLEGVQQLTFDDFRCLLVNHEAKLANIGIDLKGVKQVYLGQNPRRTDSFKIEHPVVEVKHFWLRQKWNEYVTRLEDSRQKIFYLVVFYYICICLFLERYMYYCVFGEEKDLRRIMGHGICVTRGSAAVLSFTMSLLLLTVSRNLITMLRETVINQYIPLDSAIEFHKIVACTAAFFGALHVVGHLINMYHVTTQPKEHLICLFREMSFPSDLSPTFSFFLLRTVTFITGLLLFIFGCILLIFATPIVRLRARKAFWATHHLYIPIYILTVLHGSARMLEPPQFYLYVLFPACIFTIDRLITTGRRITELSIVAVELLPSDVTKVIFARPPNFQYRSGQWIRLSCPSIAPNEYHALTLTSAPHQPTLSCHIKAMGEWTRKLRNVLDPANMHPCHHPKVQIDGPYGGGNQEWYKYEIAIFVGAGIGLTPYASILNDLVYGTTTNKYHGVVCKKVYFLWVCPTFTSWEWFVDVLRDVESKDKERVIDMHIFITQYFHKFDLRTMMLYICEQHFQNFFKRSMFTGLKAKNHFGRPNFIDIFNYVKSRHSHMLKIGVFSCGPPVVTRSIDKACSDVNSSRKLPEFLHFYENF